MLEKTAIVILAEFAMTIQEIQNHMFNSKPHLKCLAVEVFIHLCQAHSIHIFVHCLFSVFRLMHDGKHIMKLSDADFFLQMYVTLNVFMNNTAL